MSIGSTLNTHWDTLTNSIDIGQLGQTSWDFSNLQSNIDFPTQSVLPSSTPYSSEFPDAEYAFYYEGIFEGILSKVWSYVSLPDNFRTHGNAVESNTPSGTITIINKFNPSELFFDLPFTFGSTWDYEGSITSNSEVGGFPLTTNSDVVASYTVDAFGNMTMPGGRVVPALRIKCDETQSTVVFPGLPPTVTRNIRYVFISKTGDQVSVSALNETQPEIGTIQIVGVTWQEGNGATDIGVSEILANEYKLIQNYPNPFNPSTTIEYSLAENSYVRLKIYDSVGSEIAVLVNEYKNAGKYSVVFDAAYLERLLPSGVYFARLTANDYTSTIKMSLLK
jgi:hypothetical protein